MFVRNLRGIKLYESMLFSNPHFNKISGMGVYLKKKKNENDMHLYSPP